MSLNLSLPRILAFVSTVIFILVVLGVTIESLGGFELMALGVAFLSAAQWV
jgi:hypothetical protein